MDDGDSSSDDYTTQASMIALRKTTQDIGTTNSHRLAWLMSGVVPLDFFCHYPETGVYISRETWTSLR